MRLYVSTGLIALTLIYSCVALADDAPIVSQPMESIGGCLIIHMSGKSTPASVKTICQQTSTDRLPAGQTVQSLYGWSPLPLVQAYNDAQRGLSGSLSGVTGTAEVRIIIIVTGFVDARTFDDTSNDNGYNIYITTGALDFVQASMFCISNEILKKTKSPDVQNGPGLDEWFDQITPLDITQANATNWSIPLPNHNAHSSKDWVTKYILLPSIPVYEFILAHELSHIALNIQSGGSTPDEVMQREVTVDTNAFNHIFIDSPHADAITMNGVFPPIYLIGWMAAVNRFDLARATFFARSAGVRLDTPLFDIFPAMDFAYRGKNLTKLWRDACDSSPSNMACAGKDATEAGIDISTRWLWRSAHSGH